MNRKVLALIGQYYIERSVELKFPLPLWERVRVRGKGVATSLLIQTKNAVDLLWLPTDN